MSKTKTVATHESICAVCFGTYKLDNGTDRTARHGFTAHNIHHGQTGVGWHTGPCFGVSYPHYGVSCEGTKVALKLAQEHLVALQRRVEELKANPPLVWVREPSRSRRYGSAGTRVTFTVVHGDKERTLDRDEAAGFPWQETLPSYEQLLKRSNALLTAEIQAVESQIRFLTDKIVTWKPAPAVEVVQRKIVHLAALWKGKYNPTGKCSMWSMHQPGPAKEGSLTDDKSKVTCQRCAK